MALAHPWTDIYKIESWCRIVQNQRPWPYADQYRSEVLWRSLIAGKSYGSSPARADLRSSFRDFVTRIFAINIVHAHRFGLTSEAFWDNHPAYRHLSEVEQFLPSQDEIEASKRDFERLLASLSDAEKEALLSGQTQVPTNMLLNDSTLLRCDYHTQFNIVGGQLFASTYGHVGLAPGLAKLDDVLCFIRGARVPFVLRPGLNKRYRLIGDCYIHGLMHGEVESLELAVEEILLE